MPHDHAVPAKRHVGSRGSAEASPRFPLLPGGGFTLVEILVVMAIIATLSAMAMPLLSIIQQRVKVTTTQSVLRKADTAIRMFKTDLGAYPGRMGYPAAWSDSLPLRDFNRLFYHVGTNIAAADRQAILADAQSGAAMFASPATAVTHLAGEIVNEPRSDWNASYRNGYATLVNRMSRTQARMAAISGNLWLPGPLLSRNQTTPYIDKRSTPVFTAPASIGKPGWAQDYLHGEIEPRFVQDESLLDAWGRPLVYICQAIPGLEGQAAVVDDHPVTVRRPRRYGAGPIGFDPNTGPGPTLATTRPYLLYSGRITLSDQDAGDMQPTPAHATYFPDLSNQKRSDVRYYAAPGYATEFELWSSGRDRRFGVMRDDRDNADNIAVVPYHRGL